MSEKKSIKKSSTAKSKIAASSKSKKKKAAPIKTADASNIKKARRSIEIPDPTDVEKKSIVRSKEIYPVAKKNEIQKSEPEETNPAEIKMADENDEEPIDPAALARGDVPMGVISHLDEMRSRMMKILLTLMIFTAVGFFFSEELLKYFTAPFQKTGLKLNIFTLTGGFFIRMKASFLAGFLIGLPVLIFQIWRFIAPAIEKKSRKFIRNSLFVSIFLFYAGVSFVFFLLLPFAIPVLLDFITPSMASTIGADNYISFMMMFTLAMGLLFELPIVVMILTKMGIISPKFLSEKRKYAVIIMWIIAAVITPQPDLISQTMVAVPLMFLYEVSIVISKFIYKKKQVE